MSGPVRLNKYLALQSGISRREADLKIEQGRVSINGQPARLGAVIQPERDTVILDNNAITTAVKRATYILLNKPLGYVCSRKQQGNSPTIYALLPREYQRLKVAGRLDKDSCGIMLLTNDGDTIFKLTHPKFGKEKRYEVGLNKPLIPADLKKLTGGIELEDGISAITVSTLSKKSARPNMYLVVMHEGRNRQIRRTFKALGYTVTHLERIKFGPYTLKELGSKQFLQI